MSMRYRRRSPSRRRYSRRSRRSNQTWLWVDGAAPNISGGTERSLLTNQSIFKNDTDDRLRMTHLRMQYQLHLAGSQNNAIGSQAYFRGWFGFLKWPASMYNVSAANKDTAFDTASVRRKAFKVTPYLTTATTQPVYEIRVPSITLKPSEELVMYIAREYWDPVSTNNVCRFVWQMVGRYRAFYTDAGVAPELFSPPPRLRTSEENGLQPERDGKLAWDSPYPYAPPEDVGYAAQVEDLSDLREDREDDDDEMPPLSAPLRQDREYNEYLANLEEELRRSQYPPPRMGLENPPWSWTRQRRRKNPPK